MNDPFKHADKALKVLFEDVEREFSNFALQLAGFDQLNLVQVRTLTDSMYQKLDREVRQKYLNILKDRYREALKEAGSDSDKELDLTDLMRILQDYNKTVKYQYENEWIRKRDRLVESVMSAEDTQSMRESVQTGMRAVEGQVRFFSDIMVDEASRQAYVDSAVMAVQWYTREDERVCKYCGANHGNVYPIADAPTIPAHPRCRCWYLPVFL